MSAMFVVGVVAVQVVLVVVARKLDPGPSAFPEPVLCPEKFGGGYCDPTWLKSTETWPPSRGCSWF